MYGRFVKESNEDDWKWEIGDNLEIIIFFFCYIYNILVFGNIFFLKYDWCINFFCLNIIMV